MTVINARDTLLTWYARRGYTLANETKPFPYGDNRFGVPKRDDLHFVVLATCRTVAFWSPYGGRPVTAADLAARGRFMSWGLGAKVLS